MTNNIHLLADVQSANVGAGTYIWQFCVVLKNAVIGRNCNINCNVFIENDVIIGNNVTIKPGVQIWDGVTIEDKVFIGPNVTFTNDLIPRSQSKEWMLTKTRVCRGSSIGANATIIAGIEIGENALIGAGSVLTKSVKPNTLWYGNPAEHKGYVTDSGRLLNLKLIDGKTNEQYILVENKPIKLV